MCLLKAGIDEMILLCGSSISFFPYVFFYMSFPTLSSLPLFFPSSFPPFSPFLYSARDGTQTLKYWRKGLALSYIPNMQLCICVYI